MHCDVGMKKILKMTAVAADVTLHLNESMNGHTNPAGNKETSL